MPLNLVERSKIAVLFFSLFFASIDRPSAQSLEGVCSALAGSGLIDTRQTKRMVEIAAADFRHICSNKEDREARYRSSDTSAKARYSAFSAKYGRKTSENDTKESIDQMCAQSDVSFSQFVQENYSESIGSSLAGHVVDCVRILSSNGREALVGTVRILEGDETFLLDIHYSPGKDRDVYTVERLAARSDITCENIGEQITGGSTIRCTKPKGVAAQGSLVLRPSIKTETIALKFAASSLQAEEEVAIRIDRERARYERLTSVLQGRMEALEKRKSSLSCNVYTRGRGHGGIAGFSNFAACGKPDEQAVDCWFGSNHSSHSKRRGPDGLSTCQSDTPSTDWAAALCCKVDQQ